MKIIREKREYYYRDVNKKKEKKEKKRNKFESIAI